MTDRDWHYERRQHQDDDEWSNGFPTWTRQNNVKYRTEIVGDALLITVEEAARLLGIGRTTMFDLIGSEKVKSVRLGRRRLVARKSLELFVEELQCGVDLQ
jgi:excisionase family DNA binding protein